MPQRLSALLVLILAALAPAAPAQNAAPTSTTVVYVPYDKAGGPKLGPGQSVLLPYAEFLRLRATATGKAAAPAFRPAAALAQASYQGTVEGDVARLDATLTVEALAKPADLLEIRLPFHGAAVESAAIEGPKASLGPLENESGFKLTLSGEGRRTIHFKLAVPLGTDGAARRLDFMAPRAAAASLSLRIAGEVSLERNAEALPATVGPAPGGGSLIQASAGSAERLLLVYRPKVQATGAAAQARLSVDEQISLSITDRGAQAQVKMNATLLAGQTSAVNLELPAGVRLLGVAGPFVKDWSAPDAQRRVSVALVRELSQPFDLTLNVQMETAATTSAAERLVVPEFLVPGAVQQTGNILILPEAGLTIWPEVTDGLEAVSTAATESVAARKFHFSQPGWKLVLTRRLMPARIRAAGVVLYEVTEELVRLKTRQQLSIGGRGIFSATLQAPAGYELREAGPSTLVSGYRQQGRRVEINFRGEQTQGCDIELQFQHPAAAIGAPLTLEPVSVEGADENAGSLLLAMPLALKATEQGSSGVEATDIRSLYGAFQPMLTADIAPALGYRYFTAAAHAQALIERQRTRLSCETAILADVTPSLMRVSATLAYNVEFSATDAFQVLLPASAGEDVRFSGADIKEKTRASLPAGAPGDTPTTWTIHLQRRVLGAYPIAASFDVPLATTSSGTTVYVNVPRVRAAGVVRETGFIGVSRAENLEVQAEKTEGLEPRDVKELPGSLSAAFLGFRYYEPDREALRLSLVRQEIEPVLGAVIRRLHIETVLNDQFEAVHEAIFEIQNNNRQYLELQLPKDMTIWSASVRGVPVATSTRKVDGASLVELTKSESMDTAFRVRLVLKQKLADRTQMGSHGTLKLEPPMPIKGSIPITLATWKLYLPLGYRYISFTGLMQQQTGATPSWIGPAAERLLNDLPAQVAGGVARPGTQPPVVKPDLGFNTAETETEKRARLQGSALEIPIVKEGQQFEFSSLYGISPIEVNYWKSKALVAVQILWSIFVFILLLRLMHRGRHLGWGVAWIIAFLILTSLCEGFWGRIYASGLAASAAALVLGVIVHEWRRWRANMRSVNE